ncbi:bifunctional UDP-N-acetylmuramoyl-tripeptide:D-alanyl-D-alanine ligase/alanine racemase [Flavobacterium branchiicola]|uniref:Alanine racemase n=1 Tax=Flavobacterium branchiicola TaxID=1114875 RepID=A0ABV9PG87_9FLAO|nr:bifunctional UDP-N-acetylmuramoyl-tripeptide:D-alanyl-D-alanine ligase/alanine racemase [Flavobacterium branchiicola]MBS7254921.1 bifunctional UDP-N-acetylmuramoyl-tripeptide:D-alanyl-D-alanine ligase/alanine racemase [Flavobacterium branchiicola]
MSINLKNLVPVLDAKWLGNETDIFVDHISIDSRSLQNGSQTLFIALSGANNDAHLYIAELIEKGVQNFVVQYIPENVKDKANFLVVKNTLSAFQQLAAFYRDLYHFPVIGLTGSNGKTIVKEWLNFLLSPDYNIIRSPKSYNSQVGVPLSVLAINEKHNLGIFEAGISTINEMINLEKIIKPTIGVLTSIGSAHDEGFDDLEQKIQEKLLLFKESSVIIYQKEQLVDQSLKTFCNQYLVKERVLFSWSFTDNTADVFILKKETKNDNVFIQYQYQNETFDLEIPFNDSASVENTISCLLVLLYFKYDFNTIQSRVKMLYPVHMRLEVKNGINNCSIIDDSYSSDFQSLKIALDFLESQQKKNATKTIILSDIFQSGFSNEELYSKLAQLVSDNKISRMIGIGSTISSFKSKFPNSIMFENTAEFIAEIENLNFSNETILIKGARSFQFEEIVSLLEEKTHETVLEINLDSISHNLNYYKSKLASDVKIMVMVKAFGYGNGGLEIAKLLEHHKVDYLGVAFADEGISLKNGGVKLPIMVLNPESTSFPSIIQYQLEPEIYSLKGLNAFLKIAKEKNLKDFPIHIKLDTGMHRLGFEENTIEELIETLKHNSSVRVQSVLSHLATSDEPKHFGFVEKQIALFEQLSSKLIAELNINPIRHILNTSGISNFPNAQFNMVRLGIGLYGVSNDPTEQKYLENVGTLKSIISQVRVIPSGDSVGYGRRFMAQKETKIATIPIGYADGISRLWGNEVGFVTIKNQKANIVGSVCMDMLMVDVSHIDCKEGDSVIIFGESPTVVEMAAALKTIPYEIMTSISQRVKRVFFR